MPDNNAIKDTIAPEKIVFNESAGGQQMMDDADMPPAESKVYRKYLKVTPKFMFLFYKCVDTLPYSTNLRNNNGKQIRLIDFVRFIEQNGQKCTVEDMGEVITYIQNLDFAHARPLMEAFDKDQKELWEMFEE